MGSRNGNDNARLRLIEKLFGADINLKAGGTPAATVFFNESRSRIVVSVAAAHLERTISILTESGVAFEQLGKVAAAELRIGVNQETFRWQITDLYNDWWNAIRRAVKDEAERIPSL